MDPAPRHSALKSLQVISCLLAGRNVSCSVVSDSATPWTIARQAPWDSPGKNIGVGYHSLLQGISPTQGLNPGLLHCRWILDRLSHQGSPLAGRSSKPKVLKMALVFKSLNSYFRLLKSYWQPDVWAAVYPGLWGRGLAVAVYQHSFGFMVGCVSGIIYSLRPFLFFN